MEKTKKTPTETKVTQEPAATANPETEKPEESKVPIDPMAGLSDEEKKKSMKESLSNLIAQLEPRI
jgi:hypothetical protein